MIVAPLFYSRIRPNELLVCGIFKSSTTVCVGRVKRKILKQKKADKVETHTKMRLLQHVCEQHPRPFFYVQPSGGFVGDCRSQKEAEKFRLMCLR